MILYPVAIQNPDGTARNKTAKVYAHDGRTEVFVWDSEVHDAVKIMDLEGEPTSNGFRQWKVTTGEGDVLIAATGGCGCGHPLKRWSPPRPIVATQVAVTKAAADAQRAAMALVHAVHLRDDLGPEVMLEVLHEVTADTRPVDLLLSLASMAPCVAKRYEAAVAALLADPEVLRSALECAEAGQPILPGQVALSADEVLASTGAAASLLGT